MFRWLARLLKLDTFTERTKVSTDRMGDLIDYYREDNDNYRYKSYLYEDVNNEGGHIRLTIVETIDDDGRIVDRESTLTEE